MAHWDGQPRNLASWNAIRRELEKFMLAVKNIPDWQVSFVACQEASGEAAHDVVTESASKKHKGGMGPPPSTDVVQKAMSSNEPSEQLESQISQQIVVAVPKDSTMNVDTEQSCTKAASSQSSIQGVIVPSGGSEVSEVVTSGNIVASVPTVEGEACLPPPLPPPPEPPPDLIGFRD